MNGGNRGGAFKALRFASIVALAGLGVAVFLVTGSYLFWQSEKKSDVVSQRNLQELRNRLETVKREREDLRGSEATYKSLIARGAFAPERRLDFVEAMSELKKRHGLIGLEYAIAPQRPIKLASGVAYGAVGIMGSRISMKIQAYHDGELLAFLDEFPRIQRGFFPIDKCSIKRSVAVEQRAASVVAEEAASVAVQSAVPAPIAAALEAECTMEWITLVDNSKPANVQAAADVRKPL